MRHLYGILLAVAMTLVMFFVGAWGYLKLARLPVPAGDGSLLSNHTALLALAALAATALLAGLLAVVPLISPLASGVPGLLLVAWTVLYAVSVRHAVELIPLRSQSFGTGWQGLLVSGILGAVGVGMIVPLFIPSRWQLRGRRQPEAGPLAGATADSLPKRKPGAQHPNQRGEEPLVGTVLPRRSTSSFPTVDTSHVTGASRVLRNRDTGTSGRS